jgi:hypothetical protein
MEAKQPRWHKKFGGKTVNHFIASLERKFRGITMWRRRKKVAKTRKKMINGIFLHMKRDEACK